MGAATPPRSMKHSYAARIFMRIVCTFLFVAIVLLNSSAAQTAFTRPDPTKPTQIKTAVFLIDIREIDGSKQLFNVDVAVRLRWKDPRLAGSGVRTLPINSVWSPNIQIVNRVFVQTTIPETLEVDPEGNVLYRQRYIGQFSCKMDLKEFPFDRQALPIRFTSPGNSPQDIQFVQDTETAVGESLSITDWKIITWKSNQEPFQLIPNSKSLAAYSFEIITERRFYFFLVQIILPMGLIVGMSWIVFWLDPMQPGPRISISITSMLTIVAYRLLLSNFIPRLSFLTRMDYFVFACTFLVFLALVSLVAINRFMVTQREATGQKLDRLARWLFPISFAIVLIKCFVM